MKEFDDKINEKPEADSSDASYVNEISEREVNANVETPNSENSNTVSQKDPEESEIKGKNNEMQEKRDAVEETDTKTKEEAIGKETERDLKREFPQYSSSYAPPNYIPNYSGIGVDEDKKPKTRKPKWIITTVAVCIALSFVIGAAAGVFGAVFMMAFFSESGNEKEELDILKHDSSIKVNEITVDSAEEDLSVVEVAAKVSGSVVEIALADIGAAGSGVIFSQTDEYGYIVTNYHVVDGGNKIGVRLTDGTQYLAEYVDGDEFSDIAVLKIAKTEKEEFVTAVFGASEDLNVGESVVAIGNPLGTLGGTVTNGIISALDRQIIVEDIPMVLLQHNAAINSGNSGGGLFNMSGELVGIVNAKKSAEGIEGLGFAIPIDLVRETITEILENGYISGRPTLGVEVEYGTPSIWYPYGVYVIDATEDSSFKLYDRIVSVDGKAIGGILDYYAALDSSKIGKTVEVVVYRNNNKQINISVEVTEYKPEHVN